MVNIDDIIKDLSDQIYEETLKIILEKTKLTNDSSLIQSIEIVKDGTKLGISMNGYALYLDRGRRPGLPPVPYNAILRWVLAKGIKFSNYTPRQTAFIIRSSIVKKGIRPRNFLNTIVKSLENLSGFIIEKEVVDGLEKSLEDLFVFN